MSDFLEGIFGRSGGDDERIQVMAAKKVRSRIVTDQRSPATMKKDARAAANFKVQKKKSRKLRDNALTNAPVSPPTAHAEATPDIRTAYLDYLQAPRCIYDMRPGDNLEACILRALEDAASGCDFIAKDAPNTATFMSHAADAIRKVKDAIATGRPAALTSFVPYPQQWKLNAQECEGALRAFRGARWEAAVLIAQTLKFFTFFGDEATIAQHFYEAMPISRGKIGFDASGRHKSLDFDLTPRKAVIAALVSTGMSWKQARKYDQVPLL